MPGSSTLIAAQMAADMRSQGIDVIDLSVGEPDFDTPDFIKQYAWEGLKKGLTKYTSTAGTADFRRSIADFYRARFGPRSIFRRSRPTAAASRHSLTPHALS